MQHRSGRHGHDGLVRRRPGHHQIRSHRRSGGLVDAPVRANDLHLRHWRSMRLVRAVTIHRRLPRKVRRHARPHLVRRSDHQPRRLRDGRRGGCVGRCLQSHDLVGGDHVRLDERLAVDRAIYARDSYCQVGWGHVRRRHLRCLYHPARLPLLARTSRRVFQGKSLRHYGRSARVPRRAADDVGRDAPTSSTGGARRLPASQFARRPHAVGVRAHEALAAAPRDGVLGGRALERYLAGGL
mmetsp:Transcript_125487/g.363057  ORF Transcript_125487/g.363057 Transcript_125487/m.363057 type:complete len:240 (-) Transcript_125487:403-1122(-)